MNARRRHFHRTRSPWWPVMMVLALFGALTQRTFSPCGFELPHSLVASHPATNSLVSVAHSHAEHHGGDDHHHSHAAGTQKGSEHQSDDHPDCCVSADDSVFFVAAISAAVPASVDVAFDYPVVSSASSSLPLHLESGALYGRAGPARFRPASQHNRSSLFNRPPPFLA